MTPSDDSEKKLQTMVAALEDKKADDIQVIDLHGKTLVADYFVVATAYNRPQFNAIVEAVRERFRDAALPRPLIEGLDESRWVLLDAGEVVGHVMMPEERAFYDLESFWRNARPLAT